MEEYSADELQAPAWLGVQFFREILQKSENDPSFEILPGYELLPATQAGDHYASIMFRTCVRYRSNRTPGEYEMNLIIKTQPTAEGFKKEISQGNALFVKEIKMYSEILPAMVKVLKSVGQHLEVARLIHASIEPHVVIVMESLTPKGWMPGRDCITSFEEALPTIRNIASFHAASLYLHQEIVDLSSNRADDILAKGVVLTLFKKGFNEFCKAVQRWDDFEPYTKRLKVLYESFDQRLREVYTPNPATVGYNVLNHADLNWKNIMHRKNSDGRIVDSMLIDYQCCHWGSPVLDVMNLLGLVIDNRTKTDYRNEILYEYHKHFAMLLAKMGFSGKVPSLVDLQLELLRYCFLEVFHIAVFEKYKYVKLTETTFDNYDEGNPDDPCYSNEEYCGIVRSELYSLLNKGFLD